MMIQAPFDTSHTSYQPLVCPFVDCLAILIDFGELLYSLH